MKLHWQISYHLKVIPCGFLGTYTNRITYTAGLQRAKPVKICTHQLHWSWRSKSKTFTMNGPWRWEYICGQLSYPHQRTADIYLILLFFHNNYFIDEWHRAVEPCSPRLPLIFIAATKPPLQALCWSHEQYSMLIWVLQIFSSEPLDRI